MEFKDNDIVISGLSGRFPRSNNVNEFEYNLFNKIDMTDEDESRWNHFLSEVPRRFGKISKLEKFDASFFSTLNKHANWTDPQMRILQEHSYEVSYSFDAKTRISRFYIYFYIYRQFWMLVSHHNL